MTEDARRLRRLPVIRAAIAIGPLRLLRMATGVAVIAAMAFTLAVSRPDLARPADLTTDSSNYLAAGERVAGGGDLYELGAGDRPSPADGQPYWSVALLAPPPIAVVWAGLQAGPPAFVMSLWWLAGGVLTLLVALMLVATVPAWGLGAVLILAFPMSTIAWSGNVTAYLIPATVAIWWSAELEHRPRGQLLAGTLVGLSGLVRVTPMAVWWWFVLRRRWTAATSTVATVAIGVAVSAIVVGAQSWTEFVQLAQGGAAPSPRSVGGMLAELIGTGPLVTAAPMVVGLIGVGLATVLRHRPRASFAILVATGVIASPAFRFESLGLLVACLAPWSDPRSLRDALPRGRSTGDVASGRADRRRLAGLGVLGVSLAVTSIAAGMAAQTRDSSVEIVNARSAPVVARFEMPPGAGSFGFAVPADTTGIAWRDQAGSLSSTLMVFAADCTLLRAAPFSGGEVRIVITQADVRVEQARGAADAGPFLPYVSDCHPDLPPQP
jgi:hypothetical protein